MRGLFLAALLMAGSVSGWDSCTTITVGAEALWLRPTLYRPYKTIVTPNNSVPNPFGSPLAGRWLGDTRPSYAPGYRFELSVQYDCRELRIGWTSWIHTNTFGVTADPNQRIYLTSIHPDSSIDYLVSPAFFRTRDQYKVQALDGELGLWSAGLCSPWALRLFAAIRYARIRWNLNQNADGTNENGSRYSLVDHWESDIQGIGPRIGLEANYSLCWGFRLFGNASGALLIGTAKGKYSDFQFVVSGESTSSRITRANLIIANGELRFGLGFCMAFWWETKIDAQVGYQASYFSRGTVRAQFVDDASDGVSTVTRDPFALDGWLLRLAIDY